MKKRAGHTSARVANRHASASHHQAQAQPWGSVAWAASTPGTAKADNTMPQPTPPYTTPNINPLRLGCH